MKKRCVDVGVLTLCLATVFTLACGDEGASAGVTAAECVNNDLIAQCPPNTTANLMADSSAQCGNSASGSGDMVSVSASGESVCVGMGSCAVVCDLIAPCGQCPDGTEKGILTVSDTEGVVCGTCAACGNQMCEAGENPTTCPQDCATECNPNSSRCETGMLRRCAPNGQLEAPVACIEGERCAESNGSASCVPE